MKTKLVVTLMLAGALMGGCVKKSQHEDLQKRFDETSARLGETEAQAASLQEALDAAQARIEELNAELARTQEALAATQAKLNSMQAENTKLSNRLADVVKDRAKLKSSAADLKKALAELQERKAAADARVAQFKALLSRFKSLIDAGKLEVQIRDGRMILVLPTDILFASGSADLSEEGIAAISEVAGVLATIQGRDFQVEGHTDNVPIKSKRFKSNWHLASARALGVMEAMIEAGMSGNQLSAASFGEFRPVAPNDIPENKAKNRRIDIVLVPDLSTLPGFEDLTKAVK
jgi:chemotaxis protein MotB